MAAALEGTWTAPLEWQGPEAEGLMGPLAAVDAPVGALAR